MGDSNSDQIISRIETGAILYWVSIGKAVPENYNIGIKNGLWAVKDEHVNRIKDVKKGDYVLFYGKNSGFAVCEILEGHFIDTTSVWPDAVYPNRVRISQPLITEKDKPKDFHLCFKDREGKTYISANALSMATRGAGGVFRQLKTDEVHCIFDKLGWITNKEEELRQLIQTVLEGYLKAKSELFNSSNPMYKLLKEEFPALLKKLTINSDLYKFDGSGQGNWATIPWVAVLDRSITETVQSGYYPVYLFKEDMSGVYLSLNQGVTKLKNELGTKEAIEALNSNSTKFREKINKVIENPGEYDENISLNHPLYEAGNIYAKYYSTDDLPSEEELESDYKEILGLYEILSNGYNLKVIEDVGEIEEAQKRFIEILKSHSTKTVRGKAGFQGGQEVGEVYWSDDLSIWVMSRKIEGRRYWNGFGIKEPSEGKGLTITCEINFPIQGIRRDIAAAFAKDDQGNIYVVHRGKLGGNYSKKDFVDNYCGEWTSVKDGDKESNVVVIGSLNDNKLSELVKDFVFEIDRIKNGEKGIKGFIKNVLIEYLPAKDDKTLSMELVRLGYHNSNIQKYLKDIANDSENNPDLHLFDSYGEFGNVDNLAYLPYLFIYDKTIADADPFGHQYYVLYIFREDMKGVYLSLHQGHNYMESLMKEGTFTGKYGDDNFLETFNIKSKNLRAQLGDLTDISSEFSEKMDLHSENARSAHNFEAASIFSKYYTLDNLPSEEVLITDFKEVLRMLNILNNGDSQNNSFYEFYSQKRFYFEPKIVENFLLSLKVKPFVILTGNSGIGKTKIAQLFAQYISNNNSEMYEIVPVGANWTENRHILGFHNVITNEYQKTAALELIIKAEKNPDLPFFLILDEMNLSHVERYFADFLSAMESKEKIPLHQSNDDIGVEKKIDVPKNLLVIGTVNVDETTYMFSPKVLDRANTIEFSTIPAIDYMSKSIKNEELAGDSDFLENIIMTLDIEKDNIEDIKDQFKVVKTLDGGLLWDILATEINHFQEELGEAGFDFGFRVIDEILRFMYVSWVYEGKPDVWTNWMRYLDAQIKQKMLPKLHGSQRVLEDILKELFELCIDGDMDKIPRSFKVNTSDPNIKYISSALKIQEMDKVLNEQRYVSFIN